MVLTGGMMSAKEAETAGLVARVVPNDQVHTAHAAVHFTHNSGVLSIYSTVTMVHALTYS